MRTETIQTSVSYQDHRQEFLRDPAAAAAFLTAILEEGEMEPELLNAACKHVAEALVSQSQIATNGCNGFGLPDDVVMQQQVLYNMASWLKSIGLKLVVTVDYAIDSGD